MLNCWYQIWDLPRFLCADLCSALQAAAVSEEFERFRWLHSTSGHRVCRDSWEGETSIFEDTTWVGSTIYPCDFNRKQSSYWGKGGKTDAFLLLFGEDMGILYTTQKSLRRHKNYKMHREFRRKLPQHLGSLQIAQRWGFSAAADAIFRAGNLSSWAASVKISRTKKCEEIENLRTWWKTQQNERTNKHPHKFKWLEMHLTKASCQAWRSCSLRTKWE